MFEEYSEIREAVSRLCNQFEGEYWQEKDRDRAYPTEFVKALTDAGYLSVLIPEEFGGSGLGISAACAIMEEIQKSGGNGGACHAQMYTMGTVLRHGTEEQKQLYLPKIASGEMRLQAFGVTEPTSGTDTLSLRTTAVKDGNNGYVVNGQKIWTSRVEHSDLMLLLARTTPRAATTTPTKAARGSAWRSGQRAPGRCRATSSACAWGSPQHQIRYRVIHCSLSSHGLSSRKTLPVMTGAHSRFLTTPW